MYGSGLLKLLAVPITEPAGPLKVLCSPVLKRRGFVMSRRPPSTYLTADELKQIAAIKFNEAATAEPGAQQKKLLLSAHGYQNLAEMKRYLGSKELEPPK
jgi:hypothetical protein